MKHSFETNFFRTSDPVGLEAFAKRNGYRVITHAHNANIKQVAGHMASGHHPKALASDLAKFSKDTVTIIVKPEYAASLSQPTKDFIDKVAAGYKGFLTSVSNYAADPYSMSEAELLEHLMRRIKDIVIAYNDVENNPHVKRRSR
jgi:hypothetical protein